MEVRSLAEIVGEKLPTVHSLVGDALLVPEGRMLLYGMPGTYKSLLVQQLAFCLAAGRPWLTYPVARPIRAHYVQAEIVRREFQRRVVTMAEHGEWPADIGSRLAFTRLYDFVLADRTAWQELDAAAERSKAEVVIIDPLVSFMKGNENRGEDVTYFTRGLDHLRGKTGAAIVLVHHRRKPMMYEGEEVDSASEARGHTQLLAWPDTTGMVRRVPGGVGVGEVRWEKVRNGEVPLPALFRLDPAGLMLVTGGSDPVAVMKEVAATQRLTVREFDALVQERLAEGGLALGEKRTKALRDALVERGALNLATNPANRRQKFVVLGG